MRSALADEQSGSANVKRNPAVPLRSRVSPVSTGTLRTCFFRTSPRCSMKAGVGTCATASIIKHSEDGCVVARSTCVNFSGAHGSNRTFGTSLPLIIAVFNSLAKIDAPRSRHPAKRGRVSRVVRTYLFPVQWPTLQKFRHVEFFVASSTVLWRVLISSSHSGRTLWTTLSTCTPCSCACSRPKNAVRSA